MTKCPNCANKLQNRFEFCPFCGEVIDRHKFTLKHIVGHFIESFTHLDFKIIKYIGLMFARPWQIIYEYLHGKKKKFFNPYIAFVLCAGLLVFVLHKNVYAQNQYFVSMLENAKPKISEKDYLQISNELKKSYTVSEKMIGINKYFHAINLFIYAIGFWLIIFIFFSKQYNYLETVFAFMVLWTPILVFYALCRLIEVFFYQSNAAAPTMLDKYIEPSIISLFVGFAFYKLLEIKQFYWIAIFAALFFGVDNFIMPHIVAFAAKFFY